MSPGLHCWLAELSYTSVDICRRPSERRTSSDLKRYRQRADFSDVAPAPARLTGRTDLSRLMVYSV